MDTLPFPVGSRDQVLEFCFAFTKGCMWTGCRLGAPDGAEVAAASQAPGSGLRGWGEGRQPVGLAALASLSRCGCRANGARRPSLPPARMRADSAAHTEVKCVPEKAPPASVSPACPEKGGPPALAAQ